MQNLSTWLDQHIEVVIENAVAALSENERLKLQVADSVRVFYHALQDSAAQGNLASLVDVLTGWVASRSVTSATLERSESLTSLLATLKAVLWQHILMSSRLHDNVTELLVMSDRLFRDAIDHVANLERQAIVQEMQHQLDQLNARIRTLDQSKSNFIAVAAHELRTPLTLVEGYVDMAASATGVDPETDPFFAGIKSGTHRLRTIIDDIIDVALLDLQMMQFHFQPVWLHQLVRAAHRVVEQQSTERKVTIVVHQTTIPGESTYGDPDRLLQVFTKVLSNAVKYTPDGAQITVQGRALQGFTDIMIRDEGIGIDSAHLAFIFDKFSSVGNASLHSSGKVKFKGGGPGLGLPIAKGILEAHGGTIWAESDGYDEKICPGSTFHLMIPMYIEKPDRPVWAAKPDMHF